MHPKQKGQGTVVSVMLFTAFFAVFGLIIYVSYSGNKITELTHGACAVRLTSTLDDIQKVISRMTNEPDSKSIAITLEDCAQGILFANKNILATTAKLAGDSNIDFKCPSGYKGYLISFPVIKNKDGSTSNLLAKVVEAYGKNDYTDVGLAFAKANIDALKLKPVCKNLIEPDHSFAQGEFPVERKRETDRYCLKIWRYKGGEFFIEKTEISTEQDAEKCNREKPALPVL